jgi:hypothetical protein
MVVTPFRRCVFCVAAGLSVSCLLSLASYADEPTEVKSFIQRLSILQNIQTEYDLDVRQTPRPEDQKTFEFEGQTIQIRPTQNAFSGRFEYLGGNAIIEVKPSEADAKAAQVNHSDAPSWRKVISDTRYEALFRHTGSNRPVGAIEQHPDFSEDLFIDVAIGLRLTEVKQFLIPSQLEKDLTLDAAADKRQSVLKLMDDKGCIHRWRVDSSNGLKVLMYTVSEPKDSEYLRYDFSDFTLAGGVYLPQKIVITRKLLLDGPQGPNSKSWVTETATINVKKYVVGSPDNVKDNYRMLWPKGSLIRDERSGENFNVQSGDRYLSDDDIANIHNARKAGL